MMDDQVAIRRLSPRIRRGGTHSEAQRFYELGLNRVQNGDAEGGRKTWEQLSAAFGSIESEQFWVRAAQRGINELKPAKIDARNSPAVTGALEQARQLRDKGQRDKAEAIWKALEELYRNDPAGLDVLAAVRADRDKKP
jgi:hypothetical protein